MMPIFNLKEEYIQLNQLIKAMGWCENGAQANSVIEQGLVKVNGVVELRKRNKIYSKMTIEFENQKVLVE